MNRLDAERTDRRRKAAEAAAAQALATLRPRGVDIRVFGSLARRLKGRARARRTRTAGRLPRRLRALRLAQCLVAHLHHRLRRPQHLQRHGGRHGGSGARHRRRRPSGATSHQALLDRMRVDLGGRPALLDAKLHRDLGELEAFRHLVHHPYGVTLIPEKVEAKLTLVSDALSSFVLALARLEESLAAE